MSIPKSNLYSEITDPSDWKETSVPGISALEDGLRCNVCKEFISAPMMTPCGHTFCSLCVRRMLVKSQRCPQCMAVTYESQLKKNTGLEICIDAFVSIRSDLLNQLKNQNFSESFTNNEERTSLKINNELKKRERETDELNSSPPNKLAKVEPVEIHYAEQQRNQNESQSSVSYPPGHASCPVCQKILPIKQIQGSHITECLSGISSNTLSPLKSATNTNNYRSTTSSSKPPTTLSVRSSKSGSPISFFSKQQQNHMHKKIPRPNDTTLGISKLKSRVSKLGIPLVPTEISHLHHVEPTRQELLRRESEWITIWNSNADRTKPLSRAQLLEKFNEWDRAEAAEKSAKINFANREALQEQEQKELEKRLIQQLNVNKSSTSSEIALGSDTNTKALMSNSGSVLQSNEELLDTTSINAETPLIALLPTQETNSQNPTPFSNLLSASGSNSAVYGTDVAKKTNSVSSTGSTRRITTRSMSKTNGNSDSSSHATQLAAVDQTNPLQTPNTDSIVSGSNINSSSTIHSDTGVTKFEPNNLTQDTSTSEILAHTKKCKDESKCKQDKTVIEPFIPKDFKSLNRKLYSLAHNESFQELTKTARESIKKKKLTNVSKDSN